MIPAFWIVFSTILTIAWSIPFLIVPLIGFRFYVISENKVMKVIKRLPKYSSILHNDDPTGWIVGWPFIGYIEQAKGNYGNESKQLHLFTTISYYESKMKEIDAIESMNQSVDQRDGEENKGEAEWIHLYEREGCYTNIYFTRRTFDVQPFLSRENQKPIVNQILAYYETHRNAVVVLHGEKGVGKSMIPILLAKELAKRSREVDMDSMVSFCDTHKPTDPGDHFNNLYQRVDPTKYSPLVVVFEEFDIMVHSIHHQTVVPHDSVTTAIYNKASWNQFFDRFDRGYYPWTFLLLTSNHSPETIDRLDSSYLRKGRINLTFEVLP